MKDLKVELPCWIFGEEIKVEILKEFMENDAYKALTNEIESQKSSVMWICGKCKDDLIGDSIGCDCCIIWYHQFREGLKKPPKSDYYFCLLCKNKTGIKNKK